MLDAALLFAPVGTLVPLALQAVRPGGTVVCAGIHMSDIPAFPYAWLWGERRIVSVANLTRADGEAFLRVAAEVPLRVHVRAYPLAEANQALDDLRAGRLSGAAVLRCTQGGGRGLSLQQRRPVDARLDTGRHVRGAAHEHRFVGLQRLGRPHLRGQHLGIGVRRVGTACRPFVQAPAQHVGGRVEVQHQRGHALFGRDLARRIALRPAQEGRIEDRGVSGLQHQGGQAGQSLVGGRRHRRAVQRRRRAPLQRLQPGQALAFDVGADADGAQRFRAGPGSAWTCRCPSSHA